MLLLIDCSRRFSVMLTIILCSTSAAEPSVSGVVCTDRSGLEIVSRGSGNASIGAASAAIMSDLKESASELTATLVGVQVIGKKQIIDIATQDGYSVSVIRKRS
jgi:hypothetical protein